MLEAITAYMPQDEPGIGSLNYSKQERQKIALESRKFVSSKFGPLEDHEKKILANLAKKQSQTKSSSIAEAETKSEKTHSQQQGIG